MSFFCAGSQAGRKKREMSISNGMLLSDIVCVCVCVHYVCECVCECVCFVFKPYPEPESVMSNE